MSSTTCIRGGRSEGVRTRPVRNRDVIYALSAIFMLGVGLGTVGAFVMPWSGMHFALAWLGSVIGAVFLTLLALHGWDVRLAATQGDLASLKRFWHALRPSLADMLLAGVLTIAGLWLAGTATSLSLLQIAVSGLPVYLLAVARIATKLGRPHVAAPKTRALVLCAALLLMSVGSLYMIWLVVAGDVPVLAQAWVIALQLVSALCCYIAASNYQVAMATGEIRRSPTVMLMLKELSAVGMGDIATPDPKGKRVTQDALPTFRKRPNKRPRRSRNR
ncbi:hypothetical protein ASD72_16330 [Pseudoxanthomonas sp. Root630]|jgi:hypothetical protein|nr:hypothetical protein ASD72_16330 [Pseudoxanthomonas sp. Root630]